jgi:hypothetical protein
MTITQKFAGYNKRCAWLKNYQYSPASNEDEIPYWCSNRTIWHGRSDLIETVILTELIFLRDNFAGHDSEFELSGCFAYFWYKFGINKLQMQKASWQLHNDGFVTRHFREVIAGENGIHKELDLRLSTELTGFLLRTEAN